MVGAIAASQQIAPQSGAQAAAGGGAAEGALFADDLLVAAGLGPLAGGFLTPGDALALVEGQVQEIDEPVVEVDPELFNVAALLDPNASGVMPLERHVELDRNLLSDIAATQKPAPEVENLLALQEQVVETDEEFKDIALQDEPQLAERPIQLAKIEAPKHAELQAESESRLEQANIRDLPTIEPEDREQQNLSLKDMEAFAAASERSSFIAEKSSLAAYQPRANGEANAEVSTEVAGEQLSDNEHASFVPEKDPLFAKESLMFKGKDDELFMPEGQHGHTHNIVHKTHANHVSNNNELYQVSPVNMVQDVTGIIIQHAAVHDGNKFNVRIEGESGIITIRMEFNEAAKTTDVVFASSEQSSLNMMMDQQEDLRRALAEQGFSSSFSFEQAPDDRQFAQYTEPGLLHASLKATDSFDNPLPAAYRPIERLLYLQA